MLQTAAPEIQAPEAQVAPTVWPFDLSQLNLTVEEVPSAEADASTNAGPSTEALVLHHVWGQMFTQWQRAEQARNVGQVVCKLGLAALSGLSGALFTQGLTHAGAQVAGLTLGLIVARQLLMIAQSNRVAALAAGIEAIAHEAEALAV